MSLLSSGLCWKLPVGGQYQLQFFSRVQLTFVCQKSQKKRPLLCFIRCGRADLPAISVI